MSVLTIEPETEVEPEIVVPDLVEPYVPTPRQAIAHSVPERFVLYGGAMGGGKTIWLVNEAIQLSIEYPGNIGYLCRHEASSFKRTTLPELIKYLPSKLIKSHHQSDGKIILVNNSVIWYGGLRASQADKPLDRLKSITLGWFGIEEASETDEKYFTLLISRLRLTLKGGARPRYKGLCTSNPEPGWLYRRFIVGDKPKHVFVPALPSDNPHLTADYYETLQENFTPEEQEKYLQGKWMDLEGGNLVFPDGAVEMALGVKKKRKGRTKEFSVDVARKGKNWSVIAYRWGNTIRILYEHRRKPLTVLKRKIIQLYNKFKPDVVNVDEVGVGGGLVDELREAGIPVYGVISGDKPDNSRYYNFRAEMHWYFRKLLLKGKIRLPQHERLLCQMGDVKYEIRSDKKILIESKADMEKRGVESPDHVDAVVNTCIRLKRKTKMFMV